MTYPTWPEIVSFLTVAGTAFAWWIARQDRKEDEEEARDAAIKTVESQKATLAAKEVELQTVKDAMTTERIVKDAEIARLDQRVAHLESLFYGEGKRP